MSTEEKLVESLKDPDGSKRTKLAIQRNLLALDRTFLAWIRGGLASLAGSIVMIRFLVFNEPFHAKLALIIGIALNFLAIWVFFRAFKEYETSVKELKEKDPSLMTRSYSRRLIVLFLALLSLLVLFLITT